MFKRERFIGNRTGGLGIAKDIDHVERVGDRFERAIDLPVENLLAGKPGIDRRHLIAFVEKIFHHEIRRPHLVAGGADERDRLHLAQNGADIAFRVAVMVHEK